MPELSDPRREKFCQLTAQGLSRPDAYRQAGFAAKSRRTASVGGTRLCRELEVKARIGELELRREAIEVDQRQRVLDKLWANLAAASQARQYAAANRSLELLGKQLGLFKDVVQFENVDDVLKGKTDAEIQQYVRRLIVDLGMRPADPSDDEIKAYILKHAPRLGLRVVEVVGENGADGDAESTATH